MVVRSNVDTFNDEHVESRTGLGLEKRKYKVHIFNRACSSDSEETGRRSSEHDCTFVIQCSFHSDRQTIIMACMAGLRGDEVGKRH